MVTDEERDYLYAEYAKDPRMKLNLGIRRRLAPLLDNGRDEIQLMHAMLFSLPGSPVLYYGDEIGMGDNIFLGDRDGVRTPMQWTGDRNGGFSRADFQQLYLPPLMDPVYGYQAVNVEAQLRQPNSLLRWLHRLIALRKEHPVFGLGTYEALRPDNPRIFAHVRTYEDDIVLCVHNLARSAQAVELDLSRWEGRRAGGDVRPHAASRASASCRICSRLAPRGFFWFQLRERTTQMSDEQAAHRLRHGAALVRLEDPQRQPRGGRRPRRPARRRARRSSCSSSSCASTRGRTRRTSCSSATRLDALDDPRSVRELVHMIRGGARSCRPSEGVVEFVAADGFAGAGHELREARADRRRAVEHARSSSTRS